MAVLTRKELLKVVKILGACPAGIKYIKKHDRKGAHWLWEHADERHQNWLMSMVSFDEPIRMRRQRYFDELITIRKKPWETFPETSAVKEWRKRQRRRTLNRYFPWSFMERELRRHLP